MDGPAARAGPYADDSTETKYPDELMHRFQAPSLEYVSDEGEGHEDDTEAHSASSRGAVSVQNADHVAYLQSALEAERSTNATLSVQLLSIKRELATLHAVRDSTYSEVGTFQTELQEVTAELQQTTSELLTEKMAHSRAAAEAQQLRKELDQLAASTSSMEKSQQQAETLAQRLKKTVATQQNIILDAFRELSTLGSRIRSDTGITTGIVPDASPASSSSTPEHHSSESEHRSQVSQLSAMIAQKDAELAEQADALREKEAAVAGIGRELWSCGAELTAAQQELAKQLEVVESQADELRRLHATLLVFRKIAAGKRSSDKTAAQLAEVSEANDALKAQLEDAVARINELTSSWAVEWQAISTTFAKSPTLTSKVDVSCLDPLHPSSAAHLVKAAVVEVDARVQEVGRLRARVAELEQALKVQSAPTPHHSLKSVVFAVSPPPLSYSSTVATVDVGGPSTAADFASEGSPPRYTGARPAPILAQPPAARAHSLASSYAPSSMSAMLSPGRAPSAATTSAISKMRATVMGDQGVSPTPSSPTLDQVKATLLIQKRNKMDG